MVTVNGNDSWDGIELGQFTLIPGTGSNLIPGTRSNEIE